MLFKKNKSKTTNFYCFSPPVMIATVLIELSLMLFVLFRNRLNKLQKLVAATLFFLAAFQAAEYALCLGFGDPFMWSRAGFVFISTLPPLGLHILYTISKKKEDKLLWSAYISMVLFMLFFVFWKDAFNGQQCTGNYVIFDIDSGYNVAYGAYYYGWLAAALFLGNKWRKEFTDKLTYRAKAIKWLMVGYCVFLVPTAIAAVLHPPALEAIPSVMCGFAVIFAIILVSKVYLPIIRSSK